MILQERYENLRKSGLGRVMQQCREKSQVTQLLCGHAFCPRCLTFAYHKNKQNMGRNNQTKCIRCEKIVNLGDQQLRAINEFTEQVLVPLMREEEQGKNVRVNHTQASAASKQFKSHEQSVEKLTPIGGRGFYSKCESPKSGFTQSFCAYHPDQQLTVVCLSCQNTLLCISCTAGKRHTNHALKTLPKGLEAVQQQLALAKLKGRQNIDILEVMKKRTDDRRAIIQERWDKATNSLRLHFSNIIQLVNRKSQEIVQTCSESFQKWMQQISSDGAQLEQSLREAKRHVQKLGEVTRMAGSSVEIIRKSTILIQEIKNFKQPEIESNIMITCDWERIVRSLDYIGQQIEHISAYNSQLRGTCIIGSRSEEKILKENQCKRVKTNLMSLNSSREKRQKKYTKTQEDEKRNKSRANYKTESSTKLTKVNKALPAYLLQHLEKNNGPQFSNDMNPLTSSFKSTTKLLSKSHLPTEDQKRKKEHVAIIKERLERKTFNGHTKEQRQADAMRKKKIQS